MNEILVGVDFSDSSKPAQTHAIHIARRLGADVVFVYTQAPLELIPDNMKGQYSDLASGETEAVQQALEKLCREHGEKGVDVSYQIIDGHPETALVELSKHVQADLIAVGTLGRTGLQRLLLGSVAERVVRLADCKVLVARPARSEQRAETEGGAGYRRILVPTDFSTSAESAFATALTLVGIDGRIELLHCWQPPHTVSGFGGIFVTAEAATQRREDAVARSDDWMKRHGTDHARVHFNYVEGGVVAAIQRRLEDEPWDLVVMGSHGHRGLRRWILGSVAEATVRHAPCSVMVVHAESAD